jgi:hypothetical protein
MGNGGHLDFDTVNESYLGAIQKKRLGGIICDPQGPINLQGKLEWQWFTMDASAGSDPKQLHAFHGPRTNATRIAVERSGAEIVTGTLATAIHAILQGSAVPSK